MAMTMVQDVIGISMFSENLPLYFSIIHSLLLTRPPPHQTFGEVPLQRVCPLNDIFKQHFPKQS